MVSLQPLVKQLKDLLRLLRKDALLQLAKGFREITVYISTHDNKLADLLSRAFDVKGKLLPSVMDEFWEVAARQGFRRDSLKQLAMPQAWIEEFYSAEVEAVKAEAMLQEIRAHKAVALRGRAVGKRLDHETTLSVPQSRVLSEIEKSTAIEVANTEDSASNPKFSATSFFHGGCGAALGVATFFTLTVLCDSLPEAQKVAAHYYPDAKQLKDFNNLIFADITPTDYFQAASPCQGVAPSGLLQGLADERMRLYLRTAKLFVLTGYIIGDFEMVFNVMEYDGGAIQTEFESIFIEAGYEVQVTKSSAYQHGLAQNRWRVHTTVVNTRYGSAADLEDVKFQRSAQDPTCMNDVIEPDEKVPADHFVDPRRVRPTAEHQRVEGRPHIVGYVGKGGLGYRGSEGTVYCGNSVSRALLTSGNGGLILTKSGKVRRFTV